MKPLWQSHRRALVSSGIRALRAQVTVHSPANKLSVVSKSTGMPRSQRATRELEKLIKKTEELEEKLKRILDED